MRAEARFTRVRCRERESKFPNTAPAHNKCENAQCVCVCVCLPRLAQTHEVANVGDATRGVKGPNTLGRLRIMMPYCIQIRIAGERGSSVLWAYKRRRELLHTVRKQEVQRRRTTYIPFSPAVAATSSTFFIYSSSCCCCCSRVF